MTFLRDFCLVALGGISFAGLSLAGPVSNGILTFEATEEGVRICGAEQAMLIRCSKANWKREVCNDPVFGDGFTLKADGLQVSAFEGMPFALIRGSVKGGETFSVTNKVQYPAIVLEDKGLNRAFGSGGLFPMSGNPGSYMWCAAVNAETGRGVVGGWVSADRGSGVVLTRDGTIIPRVDFGRLPIQPGATEMLETFAVGCFEDARFGLEAYADVIRRNYRIVLPAQPAVHCTWYCDKGSDERRVSVRAGDIRKALKPYGLGILQIDSGWQSGSTSNGERKVFLKADPQGGYPSGMAAIADSIRAAGIVPGLWMMPFSGSQDDPWFADKMDWFAKRGDGKPYWTMWGGTCLDLTQPSVRQYVRKIIGQAVNDWGYGYLKLDGIACGLAVNTLNQNAFKEDEYGEAVLSDSAKTQMQAMREGLGIVREAAKGAFIMTCCAPQNMRSMGACVGLTDAMRIGPDNTADWKGMMRGLRFSCYSYFLNRRVWYNDPDPFFVRESFPLNEARCLASWVALSGQMNSTSEKYGELPPERLDLIRRTLPAHHGIARPVDLFETDMPRIWCVTKGDGEGRQTVLGFFNWGDSSAEVKMPPAKAELNAGRPFIAFDYWNNAIRPFSGNSIAITLPPRSCAVLSVREITGHPQVLSTSRHITQGMTDVLSEHWDGRSCTLSGESEIIGGEPYEMRLLSQTERGAAILISADAEGERISIKRTDEPVFSRVEISSPCSQKIKWSFLYRLP